MQFNRFILSFLSIDFSTVRFVFFFVKRYGMKRVTIGIPEKLLRFFQEAY